jgi:hypothetical protein
MDVGVQTGFNSFDEYLKHNTKTIKPVCVFKNKRQGKMMGSNPKIEEMPEIREGEYER